MFELIRNWLAARRHREVAIQRALQHFELSRGIRPMRGHVLHTNFHEVIVRVMFFTNHIPPDRAWYAVSLADETIRELTYDDVEALESPWR
jgi:hypothetical protein